MTDTENPNNSNVSTEDTEESLIDSTKVLKEFCSTNAEFFAKDSSENGQRLYISFLAIIDAVDMLLPRVLEVNKRVKEFDFDECTPGNGYRSYVNVVKLAVKYGIDLNQKVLYKRSSLLFRKNVLTK